MVWRVVPPQNCEQIYLAIFTTELLLKVFSMGFALHAHSYLRDVWCMLDFVVVSLAWIPVFVPSFAQYSFIRVMRALRPLRTLRFLPGMPVLIGSIFKAVPQLGSVAALCGFIFLIFGQRPHTAQPTPRSSHRAAHTAQPTPRSLHRAAHFS